MKTMPTTNRCSFHIRPMARKDMFMGKGSIKVNELNFDNLFEAVKEKAIENINNRQVTVNCPECGKEISVCNGTEKCPLCDEIINVSFKIDF